VLLWLSATVKADPEWTNGAQWYPPSFVSFPQDKSRKKRTSESPAFLDAVARLDGGLSRCSGTLVTLPGYERRDIVLTAAHCIPKPLTALTMTWIKSDGRAFTHDVSSVLASGELPTGDWALILLKKPVQPNVATPILPYSGGSLREATFVLAGYSADRTTALGNAGRDLTYDPSCAHDEPEHTKLWLRAKGCYAYPGASGGAYVAWWESRKEAEVLGPLSSLRPGVNYAVKTTAWAPSLQSYLRSSENN
jgi:hypothetical protein